VFSVRVIARAHRDEVSHERDGRLVIRLTAPPVGGAANAALCRLPHLTVLKGSNHRLFVGGPVEPSRLLLLFRLKEPPADARAVFDGVYVGGTPAVLERIITQARPTETFRAFAGSAGWAPGQLAFEMLQGAWAALPPESFDIFDKDPATLWQDCLSRLQAPRVISH
jgi:putative transcriptional regulator